ncbi:hypothetical protein ABIF65_007968 [Bradyrhizobium japonicum]|uniref:hypothetical protein n=1 Tax=Bradyrhizobium ottawaense TaxID=931866 RepID=UPI0035951EDA
MQELVAMANANIPLMDGTIDPFVTIIDENDVVFAVFEDSEFEDGIGFLIIKGAALLVDNGYRLPDRTDAIPCTSRKQAFAIQDVFGEPFSLH